MPCRLYGSALFPVREVVRKIYRLLTIQPRGLEVKYDLHACNCYSLAASGEGEGCETIVNAGEHRAGKRQASM